jgi:protein TonB
METLYRARSWFASAPAIGLFLAAIILTLTTAQKPVKVKHDPTPMKVTIAQPPQEQPTPPPPQPVVMPQLEPLQTPTPDVQLPAMPKLSPKPSPKATPTPTTQSVVSAPVAETATSVATATPAPPAPPSPPRATNAAEDDVYAAQIRAYLESLKHYPTSKEARLQRPRGTVEVWFVIDRSGGVKDAGIETSSGSLILDGAALSLVRGSTYPAFPADAFKSEANHRFTVHLNYTLS